MKKEEILRSMIKGSWMSSGVFTKIWLFEIFSKIFFYLEFSVRPLFQNKIQKICQFLKQRKMYLRVYYFHLHLTLILYLLFDFQDGGKAFSTTSTTFHFYPPKKNKPGKEKIPRAFLFINFRAFQSAYFVQLCWIFLANLSDRFVESE